MTFCSYYQARVVPQECWFFVAVLRSFEYLAFDRTYDVQKSVFEFFVPADLEDNFVDLMRYFQEQGIVTELNKLPNRLINPDEKV